MISKTVLKALGFWWIVSSAGGIAAPLSFAVIGDAGYENAMAAKVRESILAAGVKSLILPGDNLYDSSIGYTKTWAQWVAKDLNFDVVAIGNHNGGYSDEISYFKMPAENYSRVIGGKIRFVVLNSDNLANVRAQGDWFEKEMAAAQEPALFVVFHHPSYTVSSGHGWREKAAFHEVVRPILWRYRAKITSLLVGHDHLASFINFGDLPVVLSGAIHECRKDRPVDTTQLGVHVKTEWYFDSTATWARLDIESETGATVVRYIRASDQSERCTIRLERGKKAVLEANCAQTTSKDPPMKEVPKNFSITLAD